MQRRIVVTGGAGFIGSNLVRKIIATTDAKVCVLDKLTYAGSLASLEGVRGDPRFVFERVDIGDAEAVRRVLANFAPDLVMHLAAESHVDRSIDGPSAFVQTNLVGTSVLLQEVHRYWTGLEPSARASFRFHHVSTDEVYGSLGPTGYFTEATPYAPNSPYSATKAGSDHLVRAWHHTFGLPCVVTNCSNNYGPFQFPEKLIPLMIGNALRGKPLPVYGTGANVRDWLYVDDHCDALLLVAARGRIGETYNIGGNNELANLDVVRRICTLLDDLRPDAAGRRDRLIQFVTDRPGHDARYAIDARKIREELGWSPRETFETGLRRTVEWYLDAEPWLSEIRKSVYAGERLGAAR